MESSSCAEWGHHIFCSPAWTAPPKLSLWCKLFPFQDAGKTSLTKSTIVELKIKPIMIDSLTTEVCFHYTWCFSLLIFSWQVSSLSTTSTIISRIFVVPSPHWRLASDACATRDEFPTLEKFTSNENSWSSAECEEVEGIFAFAFNSALTAYVIACDALLFDASFYESSLNCSFSSYFS